MVAEERYEFKSATRNKILIVGVIGIVMLALGLIFSGGSDHGADDSHALAEVSNNLMASTDLAVSLTSDNEEGHHGSSIVMKRFFTTLWMNNVFFIGLGIIGLFFVAIQYAAQAGWSAGFKRIPLAMGSWILPAGILTVVLWFVVKGDVFHWTHADLYDKDGANYDALISGKSAFFYWPLEAGTFPIFFLLRMIIFFGLWYMFFAWIKKEMLAEDIHGGTQYWYKARVLSTVFLIIFGVSSSVVAWDWIMSIDTHWFSTMFGWYVFASWWVAGLAVITLIVVNLKEAGYLKVVNANHLHDLGKFIFAFSIFWTYIWFSQFMLIYYANIPEETIYFIERLSVAPYSWIFFLNLILNFLLPFLLLMTRDAKRHITLLQLVCPIVIVGHWFDFYNLATPGVMQFDGGLGFIEIGTALIFLSAFLMVVLSSLSKMPLVGKNHPMLEESLHHNI